jgi:thiamine pyrophosphate-dependent acetolactate synthase large subunit-like protein
MTITEALAPIVPLADRHVVFTTMAASSEWPVDADGPLVFHYVPSSMGQAPSLGLGLALAQPNRRVIVINGDGCMLMNLGSLATIGQCRPSNLTLVIIDNGIYEVTGGQPHAGTNTVDYTAVAAACRIAELYDFVSADEWRQQAERVLTQPGPVVVRLEVEPRFGQPAPKPRMPMRAQVARLQSGLRIH